MKKMGVDSSRLLGSLKTKISEVIPKLPLSATFARFSVNCPKQNDQKERENVEFCFSQLNPWLPGALTLTTNNT